MKRFFVITIYLLTVSHYIDAIQSYPTYSGVQPLWLQSSTDSRAAAKRNYVQYGNSTAFRSVNRGTLYSSSSATPRFAGNSYRGIHSTIHSVGSSGISTMSVPFAEPSSSNLLYCHKFAPPSTDDEEEPDPTKIIPVRDGTIFVMILLLIYLFIKCLNHEIKLLSFRSIGRLVRSYAIKVFCSLRRSFQ